MNILLNTNIVALGVTERGPALAELANAAENSEQFIYAPQVSTLGR